MNSHTLLERAKFRRRLAAMAMRHTAAKKEMTPQEVKKALEKTKKLQSIFGAPEDSNGKPVGKAGRTISLMEKWLKAKGDYGLPPMGEQFKNFVTQEMDGSNYIWGHEEAVRDVSRDIHYNFGFDPDQVNLVEQKEKDLEVGATPQAEVEQVALTNMAPMLQPRQGPLHMGSEIKKFTREGQYAYPMADVDDDTVLPETPVVTRVDYEEDMEENGNLEKVKKASEFEKEPVWTFNGRNVGKNDLLKNLTRSEFEHDAPKSTLDEREQFDDHSKPDSLYPVRGFVKKREVKGFVSQKKK